MSVKITDAIHEIFSILDYFLKVLLYNTTVIVFRISMYGLT